MGKNNFCNRTYVCHKPCPISAELPACPSPFNTHHASLPHPDPSRCQVTALRPHGCTVRPRACCSVVYLMLISMISVSSLCTLPVEEILFSISFSNILIINGFLVTLIDHMLAYVQSSATN